MSKESDKIAEALENMAITFDELGFSPTIPIPKGDKEHFVEWFRREVDTIKAASTQQDQRIAELEEQLKQKDLAIDKFSKIDIWLMRKYGKKLYKDFNITNDDMDIKTFIKINQVFDNIYEEMNKEMPLMWFNYGFFGLPKLYKGDN